jgi:hypothetical protein
MTERVQHQPGYGLRMVHVWLTYGLRMAMQVQHWLAVCPPSLSHPHEGGGKDFGLAVVCVVQRASLPPLWGRDGVGGQG